MHYTSNSQSSEISIQSNPETESNLYKFLTSNGLDTFKLEAIPGDASKRNYYRVITNNQTFILMDSSLEIPSMHKFIEVGQFLRSSGLNAPKIITANKHLGFLLLEDFGRNLFTSYIKQNPESEYEMYNHAIDALLKLHSVEPPTSTLSHSIEKLNQELQIFLEWYLQYNINPNLYKSAANELIQIFESLYPMFETDKQVLVLKDYMADNLIWIENNQNTEKVGILDFQDALIGSGLYDLSSLLQDARRDVSDELELHCIKRFTNNKVSEQFLNAYNIAALHKNLRIVGVFYRLNTKYGKPKYLSFIPRMWGYIEKNLKNNSVKAVRDWFEKYAIPKK